MDYTLSDFHVVNSNRNDMIELSKPINVAAMFVNTLSALTKPGIPRLPDKSPRFQRCCMSRKKLDDTTNYKSYIQH